MIDLLGNLACESEWAGTSPVPAHVARRIAALATAMRVLIDAERVRVWTPVVVDPRRAPPIAGLPDVELALGSPPDAATVLAWGASRALDATRPPPLEAITGALDPAVRAALAIPPPPVDVARRVNDRRFAVSIAMQARCALDGSSVVTTPDLLARATALAAAASPTGQWVAKAVLTAAGRDRVRGAAALDDLTRPKLERLLVRHGAVVIEPWLERVLDLGVTGAVGADADARVTVLAPHRLSTAPAGGFRGIELDAPLDDADRARLIDIATGVGLALAAARYRGVYTVDAFVHLRDGKATLRPLVEINARLSFGVIARAACARLGGTRLVVADEQPGATALVLPGPDDPIGLWVT